MKAYCINCGSIQPSKFRPGQDAITNESYEDLRCDTCHFIVATIQDREDSQQPSQAPQGCACRWDAEDKRAVLAEALAALDTAQQEPVNALLVEALKRMVEPVYFSQFSGCGLEEVSKDRYDEIAEDDRITYYTAAGASLVATPIVAWAKSTPRKLRITTMDMGGEDGWRPLGYTAAGAWQAARS